MQTVEQALEAILSGNPIRVGTETLPLIQAHGRVLAETLVAPNPVPPADNSAMDGYALHTDSLTGEPLPISQRIAAGQPAQPLEPGSAARIFTGAEIPAGANAVVMQENCDLEGDRLRIRGHVKPGQHIRPRGDDIPQGTEVLAPGRRLGPADLGVTASLGLPEVQVYRRLRVGIISSGDELVEPGQPLGPGEIYNSNHLTLGALITGLGMEAVDLGRVADSLEASQQALQAAADQVDVIVTTGGVSVGEEDHIKQAVENLGRLDLWRLAIKPGKPLAFGAVDQTPFFGLPGNPVSAFVTFVVVCRPYLLMAQGQVPGSVQHLQLPADFTHGPNATRQEYLRVKFHNNRLVRYPNQSSGVLTSVSWADGLAVVPVNTEINPGDLLEVIPLHNGLN